MPAQSVTRYVIYLKFTYLLVASTLLVLAHRWPAFAAVAAVQAVLFALRPIPLRRLKKAATRLTLLVATVFVSQLWFSGGGNGAGGGASAATWTVPGLGWSLPGAAAQWNEAAMLSARVLLIVWISVWVQLSSAPQAFVAALRGLRLPETAAMTIDATLALVTGGDSRSRHPGGNGGGGHGSGGGGSHGGGGGGHGGGGGRGRDAAADHAARTLTWRDLRARKAGVVVDLLDGALHRTAAYLHRTYPHLDEASIARVTLIAGGCVSIMSLRLLQILPGLPMAPGHKNLVVVPVMLFVAKRHGGLGGTMLGLSLGLVSFMLGYGKFGIFESLHFIVPGILADLLAPWLSSHRGPWQFAQLVVFGGILGAGRFAANAALIVLAGTPVAALVAYSPMLASQIGFGAAGALVGALLHSTSFALATPAAAAKPT